MRVKPPSSTARLRLWVEALSSVGSSSGPRARASAAAATARVPDPCSRVRGRRRECRDGHPAMPGPPMVRCDHGNDLVAADRQRLGSVGRIERLEEANIDMPIPHDRQHAVGVDDLNVGTLWRGFADAKAGEPSRQQEAADRVARGEPQRWRVRGVDRDYVRRACERCERRLGLWIQQPSGIGRADAEPSALEQRGAQAPLEPLQALACRRLRVHIACPMINRPRGTGGLDIRAAEPVRVSQAGRLVARIGLGPARGSPD